MLNRVAIAGRLGRDPELRYSTSNVPVSNFVLAVDRDYKDVNGERGVDWIECVAWRGTAEFVSKYFSKGRVAIVTGRLQVRNWTDKDGNNRKTTEVVADNVYFGDSKRERYDDSGDLSITADVVQFEESEDDGELPF